MSRVRRLAILAAMLAVASVVSPQTPDPLIGDRRADIAEFRAKFLEVDNSYSPSARAEAVRRLTRLETMAGEVSAAYFEIELARIVALADNGHTNSPAARRSRRFSRIPLRFVPLGTGFYVLRADTANADLLGARLAAIDGERVEEILPIARTLWGGIPAWRDRQVPFLLESPDQLYALDITARSDRADYELVLADGQVVRRGLGADPPNPSRERYGTVRWLSPEAIDTDRDDWRMLGSLDLPWAFRDPDILLRWRPAPEIDAIVAQLRINNDGDRRIADYLAEVRSAVKRLHPGNFVLDMRFNGGGDLNTTRDFVRRLPGLVPGRIFVLTSPWTFSAAISTTGYLKQAGGDRVTIVGEEVGDRLEFWAEGGLVQLSHSGAAMTVATERHDYRTGCRPFRDCHRAVVNHPIAVASLAPDIEAPVTIEAYRAGRDPGMEAIAAALQASR